MQKGQAFRPLSRQNVPDLMKAWCVTDSLRHALQHFESDLALGDLAQGNDVLLEIDWQGARQVRERFDGTVGIFILPPSIEALEWRLHHRGTDSEQTITRRLLGAGAEMSHAPEFEYVIINEDFETALSQMQAVVVASRLAFGQQAVRHREQFASLGIPL